MPPMGKALTWQWGGEATGPASPSSVPQVLPSCAPIHRSSGRGARGSWESTPLALRRHTLPCGPGGSRCPSTQLLCSLERPSQASKGLYLPPDDAAAGLTAFDFPSWGHAGEVGTLEACTLTGHLELCDHKSPVFICKISQAVM